MDRLCRVLASGCLALALGAIGCACGCRSMRSEVPAGKPYSTTGGMPGGAPPTVGFNSSPRSNPAYGGGQWANGPTTPGSSVPDGNTALSGAGSAPALGTPAPNSSNYGSPVGARFGAPATNSGYNPGN